MKPSEVIIPTAIPSAIKLLEDIHAAWIKDNKPVHPIMIVNTKNPSTVLIHNPLCLHSFINGLKVSLFLNK